jgi:hypothetical protein
VRLSTKLLACKSLARLAQSVERKALNLEVVGSSPTVGVFMVVLVANAVDNGHYLIVSFFAASLQTCANLRCPQHSNVGGERHEYLD